MEQRIHTLLQQQQYTKLWKRERMRDGSTIYRLRADLKMITSGLVFFFFWIFSFFYFKETQKLLQNSRKKHFFRTLNLVLSKFILRRSLIFLIKLFVFYFIFSQTNYVFLLTHFILSLMLLQVIHIGFTKCVWERKTLRRFSSETSKQNNRTARTDGINVNVSNVSTYLVERHKNDKCQKVTECKG